ncbi:hypothetical protein AYO38_00560 [bacterium SCGC AG-212-C10]|nr:hypothetical protein AYO38_00560 [bacterium SCGC AG-212-C10]
MPDTSGPGTIVQLGDSTAAGYCGRLLATSGRQVISVVTAGSAAASDGSPAELATRAYLAQGKVAIDASSDLQPALALIADAECLITDRTLGELAAFGIATDLETARKRPLVVVSITPWGSDGPPAMRNATDLLMFHGGGLGVITPRFANNPEEPPLRLGYPVSDYLLGLNAAVAAMAGINHLRETGEGSVIDCSGQHAVAHAEGLYFAYDSYEQRNSTRVSQPGLAPFHFLPCLDGYVMIICPEEHQWRSLVTLMGSPEWAEAETFATSASRALYWDAIEPLVVEWLADKTREELYHRAQAARVPLAPVNNVDSLLSSAHLRSREFFSDLETAGRTFQAPGRPYRQTGPSVQH